MATAPKAPKAPELAIKIGDVVLDRYRIVEQIASGGHSVVFRGLDERLSRPVCIKVFSGLGGNSGVGRTSYEHFVQEAFALSRLTHPNTLRIYDFGHLGAKDAEGMPLQVCEFMNGGTLAQIVREQGNQSLAETARIIEAMCLALAEAHGLGIVHRDIKPQNILFGAVGGNKLPKLADFGIAKWSTESEPKEQRAEDTAIVAGQKLAMYSPSWAAPEQLAGQPVSAATDIYSLACVAVYMLSGKAIFADEDVYAGYRKRRQADQLVRDALEPLELPPAVVQLLTRALSFDPKKRLANIDELASELIAAIDPVSGEQPFLADTTELPALRGGVNRTATVPPGSRPSIQHAVTLPQMAPPPPPRPRPPSPPPPAITEPTPPPPPAFAMPAFPPAPRPATWTPPTTLQPWMLTAPSPHGTPRLLPLSDLQTAISDRRAQFVHAQNLVADLIGNQTIKIRVTFQSGPTGARQLHVKGLTCFVAHLGGRPSPAVQLEHASDIAFVTPRAQEIGHLRVATGTPRQGQLVFAVGTDLVAVNTDDCMDVILFDFGPGSDAYFVYTQGRPIPRSRRG